MLIVAVVHQLMKRRSRRPNGPASKYPGPFTALLAAPYIAIVAAAAAGIAVRQVAKSTGRPHADRLLTNRDRPAGPASHCGHVNDIRKTNG